tara:strand:+ start:640 stop:1656 length:1017 start_codon:yes stop_codon:yes gene_type:complete
MNRHFYFVNKELQQFFESKLYDYNLLNYMISNYFNTNHIINEIKIMYYTLINKYAFYKKFNHKKKKGIKTLWNEYKEKKHLLYHNNLNTINKFTKYTYNEIVFILLEEFYTPYYLKMAFYDINYQYSLSEKLFDSSTFNIINPQIQNNMTIHHIYFENYNVGCPYNILMNQFNYNSLYLSLLRIYDYNRDESYYLMYYGFNYYDFIKQLNNIINGEIIILLYTYFHFDESILNVTINTINSDIKKVYDIKYNVTNTIKQEISYENYDRFYELIHHIWTNYYTSFVDIKYLTKIVYFKDITQDIFINALYPFTNFKCLYFWESTEYFIDDNNQEEFLTK